jgi:hypothetical protein
MGTGDQTPQQDPGEPQQPTQGGEEEEVADPQVPEMPEEEESLDFNDWKKELFKLAIKGDPQEMILHVQKMRDQSNLESPQKKIVEDNWQILVLRQNGYIEPACKEIRKLIKSSLDRNNPASAVMYHLTSVLEQQNNPMLRDVFVKLTALFGLKSDLHRKFIAALTGCVQVGGGGSSEDIAYSEKDYSIRISTRFGTQFGEISVGRWNLQQDDAEQYLSEPELDRLSNGSPEEKQVLRRRIVIESIAERFKNRSFLIHVVTPEDGTIYHLGWDMSESLLSGYKEGKLIVRSKDTSDSEAMIDDDGNIVPLLDLTVYYLKETGETDKNGRPEIKEVPFMERRDGMLYLCASLEIVRDVSTGMSGMFFKESPYSGNPSDIKNVTRSIPNIEEILMRRT